jgi:hypothetical protein
VKKREKAEMTQRYHSNAKQQQDGGNGNVVTLP